MCGRLLILLEYTYKLIETRPYSILPNRSLASAVKSINRSASGPDEVFRVDAVGWQTVVPWPRPSVPREVLPPRALCEGNAVNHAHDIPIDKRISNDSATDCMLKHCSCIFMAVLDFLVLSFNKANCWCNCKQVKNYVDYVIDWISFWLGTEETVGWNWFTKKK